MNRGQSGIISIHSSSKITPNKPNLDVSNVDYNLKFINFDPSKRYEIALMAITAIASSDTSKDAARDFIYDRYITIYSNIVKSNDYSSMTNDSKLNNNTRRILCVVPFMFSPEIFSDPGPPYLDKRAYYSSNPIYQEMEVSNFSNMNILLAGESDEQFVSNTERITEYTLYLHYREIK